MKRTALVFMLLVVMAAPALATGNVIYTSPAGGEVWVKGSTHALIYSFSQALGYHMVTLHRNGAKLGIIRYTSYPVTAGAVINYPWPVGKVTDDNGNPVPVPIGSGYTIAAGLMSGMVYSNQFTIAYDFSNIFKIKKFFYNLPPDPGGCPQCLILDLTGLREELVKLDELVAVGLYWRGPMVADLGQIGKGRGFAAKLQVKLGPEAFAAMNRGEEFELRLLSGRKQLLHSQAVRLVASGPINPRIEPIRKR